jgi:hypothetical protein
MVGIGRLLVAATLKRDVVDDTNVGVDDSTRLIVRSRYRKVVLVLETCFVSVLACALLHAVMRIQ